LKEGETQLHQEGTQVSTFYTSTRVRAMKDRPKHKEILFDQPLPVYHRDHTGNHTDQVRAHVVAVKGGQFKVRTSLETGNAEGGSWVALSGIQHGLDSESLRLIDQLLK